MLSIADCREYLNDSSMADREIEAVRNSLYGLVEAVLDSYEKNPDIMNLCKKEPSYTAESHQPSKVEKVMV